MMHVLLPVLISSVLLMIPNGTQSQSSRWTMGETLTIDRLQYTWAVCPNATPIVAVHSTHFFDLQAHTSDRRWEFTCASSDINFRWGVWTGETTHVRDPFTILCPQGTYIGGVASRYIKVEDDRVWELLCNRLPEGRELGSCGWTFFMNQPFQNLTLPTLRHMTILKGMKTRLIFHQDRLWQYQICFIRNITCAVPNIRNMNPPSDSWSAGSVEPRRISLDNSIHFTCQPGYFRTGPHEATCTINGTWTTLPSCTACTSIVHCAEVVCTSMNNSLCLHCHPYHNRLTLLLSNNRRRCYALPAIQHIPLFIHYNLSDSVLIPCRARGIPHPTVTWYRSGEAVGAEGRVRHLRNGSLLISNTTFDDDGLYRCVATNKAGQDSQNITLLSTLERPVEPPVIIGWEAFRFYHAGSTVLVTCEAIGYPPPTISWSRYSRSGSISIPTLFNLRVYQFQNGTLGFFPANDEDSGTYTCTATNLAGQQRMDAVVYIGDPFDGFQGGSISLLPEDLSTSGQSPPGSASGQLPPDGSSGDVIVSSGSGDTSPPDIINWENHHSVMIGAVLELSCKATGTPQPTVSWISRGVQVGEEEEDQGVRTRPNGSLIIWKVGMEHEGRYKCVAWNHHGLAFRTTEVAVVTGAQLNISTVMAPTLIAPTHSVDVTMATVSHSARVTPLLPSRTSITPTPPLSAQLNTSTVMAPTLIAPPTHSVDVTMATASHSVRATPLLPSRTSVTPTPTFIIVQSHCTITNPKTPLTLLLALLTVLLCACRSS